jgi:hypothetical protein
VEIQKSDACERCRISVGFVCFAMATLWIRYEMTYDSFLKNADRIYCVSLPDALNRHGTTRRCPRTLAAYLKSTFPEISNAIAIYPFNYFECEYEGVKLDAKCLRIDSSFFSMFDVKIVEGNMDFLIPESEQVAITREKSLQFFGNESPIGKRIRNEHNPESMGVTIGAVVTGLPKRSNYPFDVLFGNYVDTEWKYGGHILIEIVPDVDIESVKQKLYEHEIQRQDITIKNITLTPLASVRYTDPNIEREVKIQHIIIFAVAGSLLILCTLFNYITLFVSRFRIRQRELALRAVYGASEWSLFAMLSVEFLLSLIAALTLGAVLTNILIPPFLTVSEITGLKLSAIYLESIIYITVIIAIALMAFFLTIVIFKRRTLDANIRSNKKILRRASIVVQLIISIVFAFCTLIILKQMYYLHNTDLGFAFKNCGSMHLLSADFMRDEIKVLNDKIKQIPEIEEAITGYQNYLCLAGRLLKYRTGTINPKTFRV